MPRNRPYSESARPAGTRLIHPIDPRVRHISLDSLTLGVRKSFYVALPPGYASRAATAERYPTLYLFRGHEREWINRTQDKARRGRTVIDVYRQLLDEGIVGKMILVFPGMSSADNRVPGLAVNFRAPELARGSTGVGTGRFESYLFDELIPYVDASFRTIPERAGRAVDGFSLGGFVAVKAAAARPDLFSSAGAFDGTFLYATNRGLGVRERDRVLRNPMFGPAFGAPPDMEFVARNSPANLIWRGDAKQLSAIQWLIRSGPEACEPWRSNYFRAQHLIGIMRERKIPNGIGAVFPKGLHTWYWADKHMADTLPRHWKVLSTARNLRNGPLLVAGDEVLATIASA